MREVGGRSHSSKRDEYVWGAHAASVQFPAACRKHLLTRTAKQAWIVVDVFAAGSRERHAGSVRSPNARQTTPAAASYLVAAEASSR